MIVVKTSTSGDIYLQLEKFTVLEHENAMLLYNKAIEYVKNDAVIVIDLSSIENVHSSGFNILFKLMQQATPVKCKISYINVPEKHAELIETLTITSES